MRHDRNDSVGTRAWPRRLAAAVVVAGLALVGSQAITQARHGGSQGRPKVAGVVEVGGQPAAGWQVDLYAAGRD